MSVAGTKNFDQPPHDSNRTHLVFSTSGLLLGSRAPLVFFSCGNRSGKALERPVALNCGLFRRIQSVRGGRLGDQSQHLEGWLN